MCKGREETEIYEQMITEGIRKGALLLFRFFRCVFLASP